MLNSQNVEEADRFERAGKCSKVEEADVRSNDSKSN